MKRPALLLVDLQEDFLERPGLLPARSEVTARAAGLLAGCRELGVAVVHVHTRVRADGSDRMPHWKRADYWACVEGTPGACAPAGLDPVGCERVFAKQFYSAFGALGLDAYLRGLGVDALVVGGLYLHACVRATAQDAYERGYDVWIAGDAVGSTDGVHAELTRDYLNGRVARFDDTHRLLERLGARSAPSRGGDPPSAGREDLERVASVALRARTQWRGRSVGERADLLERWADRLADGEERLADLLVREIAKPRGDALAEVRRAVGHVRSARRILLDEPTEPSIDPQAGVYLRWCPVGTVGLVTPWNNPLGIPAGKIAPALAFGNAVVWKAADQAPQTAGAIAASLLDAGFPEGLVGLVFGGAETARYLIEQDSVDAISVTGSIQTGRSASALCAQRGKPLQAELGGNNAAIVLDDCTLEEAARALASAAFAFAGQRCTATRRIIVARRVLERFTDRLIAATAELKVGDPSDTDTCVGPLISAAQQQRVADAVELARRQGGRILCGGSVPRGLGPGSYYAPTLVTDLSPSAHLVREETFGPVAVVMAADDLDDAIRLTNAVPQGLIASLCTRDAKARRRFIDAVQAGILKLAPGALAVHPDAPFGGWKASGIGPPEHGAWDRQFYARPQAVYAEAE